VCFYSDDNGRSWAESNHLVGPEDGHGFVEPDVMELKTPNHLLMMSRTDQDCLYQSWSYDGGESWEAALPSELLSACGPETMARIPQTGDLMIVWNDYGHRPEGMTGWRTPLTAAISRDEGQSWETFLNLEEEWDANYGYPAIAFHEEYALVAYGAGDSLGQGLRLARFPVEKLYP
jgi:hypothetical protein